MKLFKFLAIFGLLLAQREALATPMCAAQLISPDKTVTVRIIGNYHLIPSKKDKLSRMALFEKAKEHSRCLFLVEDPAEQSDLSPENKEYLAEIQSKCSQEDVVAFLLGLVEDARAKGFNAKGIDNRPEEEIDWKEQIGVYKKYTEKQYEELLPHIPKELKSNFNKLYREIRRHWSEYREDDFTNYYAENYGMYSFFLEVRVFDYVILSHILRNVSDYNMMYVCIGGGHSAFICSALQRLGYTPTPGNTIPNIGLDYRDLDVRRELNPLTTPLDLGKTLTMFDKELAIQPMIQIA